MNPLNRELPVPFTSYYDNFTAFMITHPARLSIQSYATFSVGDVYWTMLLNGAQELPNFEQRSLSYPFALSLSVFLIACPRPFLMTSFDFGQWKA